MCYIDETVRIYEIGVHLRTYGVRGCDFARIHSFAPDVDISRPHARVSSVLALEIRSSSSRESVRDVERVDARNRGRASRARARDPFHSSSSRRCVATILLDDWIFRRGGWTRARDERRRERFRGGFTPDRRARRVVVREGGDEDDGDEGGLRSGGAGETRRRRRRGVSSCGLERVSERVEHALGIGGSAERFAALSPWAVKADEEAASARRRARGAGRARAALAKNPDRFCLFPIKHRKVWEMYKKAEASFWTAEEVDLTYDYRDWITLNDNEQHFISHVLAFSRRATASCWRICALVS